MTPGTCVLWPGAGESPESRVTNQLSATRQTPRPLVLCALTHFDLSHVAAHSLASLCLVCLASGLPQGAEDEWLAVINGNSGPAPAVSEDTRPRSEDVDYYQFQDNRRAPPVPIQTGIPDNRRVGVAGPPPQGQQRQPIPQPQSPQVQRQPLPQPPRGPPQRRQPQQPLRGPPPPALRRPLPPPTPKPAGILDTVVNGVNSVLNPVASGVTCAATNLIADEKLKDETFIRSQMDCAMSRGPCDEVGKKIKCKFKYLTQLS